MDLGLTQEEILGEKIGEKRKGMMSRFFVLFERVPLSPWFKGHQQSPPFDLPLAG